MDRRRFLQLTAGAAGVAVSGALAAGDALAAPVLQCVHFARDETGLDLKGDAWTWWDQAKGLYERGQTPRLGAVLVFRRTREMRHGHVAVVSHLGQDRQLMIDHANWGADRRSRGKIAREVPIIDVSPRHDWTYVRVLHSAEGGYGRVNPAYGFIYPKQSGRIA